MAEESHNTKTRKQRKSILTSSFLETRTVVEVQEVSSLERTFSARLNRHRYQASVVADRLLVSILLLLRPPTSSLSCRNDFHKVAASAIQSKYCASTRGGGIMQEDAVETLKPAFLTDGIPTSESSACFDDGTDPIVVGKTNPPVHSNDYEPNTSNTEKHWSRDDVAFLMQKEANYDINNVSRDATKRIGYLPWDEYFMAVAFLSAQRSKDPHSQVGACIVDESNRIVGIGYNGFPWGCPDDCLPWAAGRDGEHPLHTRDPFMCHAEVNAILNKCSNNVKGARMYVAHFPCNECAKVIIQAGLREVIFVNNTTPSTNACCASRIMFQMAGVTLRRYTPIKNYVCIDFGPSLLLNGEPQQDGDRVPIDSANKVDGEMDARVRFRDLLLREAGYDPMREPTRKRLGYLSWDDYFMAVAFLSAMRSKDPNTQVGACIVDENKRVVGIGYNGFPSGCSDEHLPWARGGTAECELHTKYPYVVHAEVNAILNKCSADVKGATLYVALFPCNECAKIIIQSGISEVVYLNDKYHDTKECRASRIMFEMAGVKMRQHQPKERVINVQFHAPHII